MTDQELRDKLASEYGANSRHLKTEQHFKDGWDAARANDQLKAEVERLSEFGAIQAEEMANLSDSNAKLRAAAEKLAEALRACEDVAYSYDMHPKGFSVVFDTAKQALAEYREKFPKDDK